MCISGRGIGTRVRGVKGASSGASSVDDGWSAGCVKATGEASMLRTGIAALVSGCCDAGAGLNEGLGSDKSADDGRMGESTTAGGTVTERGVTKGIADLGCSAICGGGLGADTGSKLNGLLCSVGGGSGESGDIA